MKKRRKKRRKKLFYQEDYLIDAGTIKLPQATFDYSFLVVKVDYILSETRLALHKAGIEALYWAQKYPDEVEAIIGLDMAVPEYYEKMKINLPLMKLGQYAADLGITRLIPALAESDAFYF